jgi:hypothetical protein
MAGARGPTVSQRGLCIWLVREVRWRRISRAVDRAAGRLGVELGRRRRDSPSHKMRGRARLQRGDPGHELDYEMRDGATEAAPPRRAATQPQQGTGSPRAAQPRRR